MSPMSHKNCISKMCLKLQKSGFVNQKVTKLDHMMFGMILQEEAEEVDGKL